MTEEEIQTVDALAKTLLNDKMTFGAFEVTVTEIKLDADETKLELCVVNKDELSGFAFRCDGRIRTFRSDEAVRKVLTHD